VFVGVFYLAFKTIFWPRSTPRMSQEPAVDLSLLGFTDLEDAGLGESWERKVAPAGSPPLPAVVESLPEAVNSPASEVAASPESPPPPRPESATSAWIEHCRQLEAQLALTRLSNGDASNSSNSSSSDPPPPPKTPVVSVRVSAARPKVDEPTESGAAVALSVAPPPASSLPDSELSLEDILDELTTLYDCASQGLYYDEARLEMLQRLQESNPEYQENVAAEHEEWRRSVDSFLCEALLRTRSYVPPDIFSTTFEALLILGLTPEIARRVLGKKCLWLTRMSSDEISRLHEADLNGRFNTQGENLDLVEMAAVYASLPDRFINDRLGKKVEWKDGIERTLREWLGSEEAPGTVPEGRARHEMYEAFFEDMGPVSDTTSVREVDVVSSAGSQGPRNSFQEVCKRHSILSLRRRSLASDCSESDRSSFSTPASPTSPN